MFQSIAAARSWDKKTLEKTTSKMDDAILCKVKDDLSMVADGTSTDGN